MQRFLLVILFGISIVAGTRVRAQTYVSVERQDTVIADVLNLFLPVGAEYDGTAYKVRYRTTDALGQPDTASGLLVVPEGNDTLAFPLAVYMHGTTFDREAVPSRPGVAERQIVNGLSGRGYIALAPDYIGLGDSEGFHPYVHADSESQAGYDMILAVRQWLREQAIPFNEQLFITGYSQGGHASMALHRDIEADADGLDTLRVRAGAHLSGPYSISGVMREATLARGEQQTFPGYVVYTYVSYAQVYGLFEGLEEAFVDPYLSVIRDFNEGRSSATLFNDSLSTLLTERDERLIDMFQDSIAAQIENDDDDSRIVQALRRNDTYEWAPDAPTLLYYCTQDQQVPFTNALVADSTMRALGSESVELRNGGALSHTACVPGALIATLAFFDRFAVIDVVTVIGANRSRANDLPELRLSPNPVYAGEVVQLRGLEQAAAGGVDYVLYDAMGRGVQRGRLAALPEVELRIASGLGPGTYVLRLNLPNRTFAVRRLMLR